MQGGQGFAVGGCPKNVEKGVLGVGRTECPLWFRPRWTRHPSPLSVEQPAPASLGSRALALD